MLYARSCTRAAESVGVPGVGSGRRRSRFLNMASTTYARRPTFFPFPPFSALSRLLFQLGGALWGRRRHPFYVLIIDTTSPESGKK